MQFEKQRAIVSRYYEKALFWTHLTDGKFATASRHALDFHVPRQLVHPTERLEALHRGVSLARRHSGKYFIKYSVGARRVEVERRPLR